MTDIESARLGQALVYLIVGSIVAWGIYKEFQELGIRRRTRDSLRTLLESSNEDWWVEHRAWLSRERTPRQLKLDRAALIDAAEEDYHAFALDHDNQTDSLSDNSPRAA